MNERSGDGNTACTARRSGAPHRRSLQYAIEFPEQPADRLAGSLRHWTGFIFVALATLVVAYAALLRLDALTHTYGPVQRPEWLRVAQQYRFGDSALRPSSLAWAPHVGRYVSDPYTYLQYAREMRSFYAAHRREPLFPFATRVWLWLLSDQDVAVSFASASFSLLSVVAVYLLGSVAFSRAVGLGAASLAAIEYDVITWGVGGWRDDAFTCAVVSSAYMMLRCLRKPTRTNFALLGIAGGIACLIRITSLSFLVPGLGFLLFASPAPWPVRLRRVGLGGLIIGVIVAPFVINCWRVFGDPLYAINVHADVYRAAEGQTTGSSQTAAGYLGRAAGMRPIRTLDTFVIGMTAYPFRNKWTGFEPWMSSSGMWLSWAAIIGLVLFTGLPHGRLLLLVLATSLVPYAATWRLISDWRFTAHAYPFFLIAAMVTVAGLASLLRPERWRAPTLWARAWRPVIRWALTVSAVIAGGLMVTRVLPVLVVREALNAHEEVTIMAGERDRSFFGAGWSRPLEQGITVRVSEGRQSTVWIPLPRVQDYSLTIRLDPFPPPLDNVAQQLPRVRIFANGRLVSVFALQWNPERVGAYDFQLPGSVVKRGFNSLVVMPEPAPGEAQPRIRLWYVRVRPPADASAQPDRNAATPHPHQRKAVLASGDRVIGTSHDATRCDPLRPRAARTRRSRVARRQDTAARNGVTVDGSPRG